MMKILIFILYLVTTISHNTYGIQHKLKEDLKFERKPNESPVKKTIYTKFGDIVDCIDIYKQPAFDHHLLKNHKLQRKPSSQALIQRTNMNNSQSGSVFGLNEEICPEETVPILRISNENDDRPKEILNDPIDVYHIHGLHVAKVYLRDHYGPYYRVSGVNSVWNPRVHSFSQVSVSNIWVENGPVESLNKISTGWHVLPGIYNGDDMRTRFFASWTSDNYNKTGCTNHRCYGFVQTDRNNYLGALFNHISVYGGPTYDYGISIFKDPVTENWWISLNDKDIGYFPGKLFSNLSSAESGGWGGRTIAYGRTASPQMGSGYFPDGNSSHACYFRNVLIQTESKKIFGPQPYQTLSFSDRTDCFGIKYSRGATKNDGYVVQFGGPGGNCGY